MAKLNSTELKLLKEVEEWRESGPGFLNQASHFATQPVLWAAKKLIPEEALEKGAAVSDAIADKLRDFSKWTVSEEEVLKATREFEIDSKTILELRNASVFDLNHVAEEFTTYNQRLAMAEGFGTGLLGWPGILADLPALFMLCSRLIYQTSLCYGYAVKQDDAEDPENNFELGYMLRVLKIATISSSTGKEEALRELRDYEEMHPGGIQRLGGDYAREQVGKAAAVNVTRLLVNEIVKETLARKAITSIPGIGAVLTAGFNYYYVQDVGRTAGMLYRERFLLDKQGRRKIVNVEIE